MILVLLKRVSTLLDLMRTLHVLKPTACYFNASDRTEMMYLAANTLLICSTSAKIAILVYNKERASHSLFLFLSFFLLLFLLFVFVCFVFVLFLFGFVLARVVVLSKEVFCTSDRAAQKSNEGFLLKLSCRSDIRGINRRRGDIIHVLRGLRISVMRNHAEGGHRDSKWRDRLASEYGS